MVVRGQKPWYGRRVNRLPRLLLTLLPAALALAVLSPVGPSSCSPVQQRARTDFWLEALADPVLEVDPAARLPADATGLDAEGLVVNHGPSFDSPTDYTLEILGDAGDTLFVHYSLGAGQRIGVERGELVRVVLWQHKSEGGPPLRALMLEAYRAGDLLHRRVPVAIVQVNGLISKKLLPEPLRHVVPHDEVTYQTSERLKSTCARSLMRRGFASDADLAASGDGAAPKTWPPGAKSLFSDEIDRFEVNFVDNRELIASDCPDQHKRLWAWTALYVAPPPGTKQNLHNLLIHAPVGAAQMTLPTAPTPTTPKLVPAPPRGTPATHPSKLGK